MKIKEGGGMDIQEIQEKFEDLLLANPDFDESLLEKDEEGCYSDSDIQHMYSMFEAGTEVGEQWQAAKAQAVPEGFVLISKNDLKMELCSIRHLNSGEYSKSIIEDCVCNIEAMIEAQEPTND